jgi:hypothetical protein
MFNTPVLFIVFNRLDTTKQVFSAIRQVKPSHLFIAADGPRSTVVDEAEKCQTVRKYVLDNIDWDCEVHSLFREENLGCGKAVSEAITWFFGQVEQGIILEDDCVPSISFFSFCEELLAKYKDSDLIYHIAGNNPLDNTKSRYSYYFDRIEHMWGWATWRRAWNKYEYDIDGLDDFIKEKKINKLVRRGCDREYWLNIFKQMEKHEIDTWDYQWTYVIFKNDGLCINPSKNLISNIGFGVDSTHTFDTTSIYNNQPRYDFLKIKHPTSIKTNSRTITKIHKIRFGIDCWLVKKYKRNKQRFRKLLKLCKRFLFNGNKVYG